ncbi:phospholipase D-like domain-containing protein [Nocardia sp. NPDC088792]|uniref:phospholipase D-like domain-containing protein n=1 Tax=Nocardia sp. NPDC088792 TaxID=3364332 RepID=UPI003823AD2A
MTDDPRLARLGRFTPEGALMPGYGDTYLFLVGRDDVHSVLKTLIGQETLQIKLSMFGYDDDELNEILMAKLHDRGVHVQVSLDRSQANCVHERKILDADRRLDPAGFANSVVVTDSPTHQILHTKGGVLAGQSIALEGSTNWSASGEGIGIDLKGRAVQGFRAQANTLVVSTNPVLVSRLSARLDVEHHTAARSDRPAAA